MPEIIAKALARWFFPLKENMNVTIDERGTFMDKVTSYAVTWDGQGSNKVFLIYLHDGTWGFKNTSTVFTIPDCVIDKMKELSAV